MASDAMCRAFESHRAYHEKATRRDGFFSWYARYKRFELVVGKTARREFFRSFCIAGAMRKSNRIGYAVVWLSAMFGNTNGTSRTPSPTSHRKNCPKGVFPKLLHCGSNAKVESATQAERRERRPLQVVGANFVRPLFA